MASDLVGALIAARHNAGARVKLGVIAHSTPAGACVISGSKSLERLDLAVRALEVKLAHHERYGIYTASGQQVLR